jgi:hypothetical protein
VLSSDSASTKWAYQTVAVDASRFYEFAASLKPDGGVESASLRISWYASGDESGSALETTDSTSKVAGPAASYESVTTGSVAPPSSARSARLRVMLAPSGDAAATLYFDDVSFAEAAAPSATPQPSASPTSTSKPSLTDTPKAATRTPAPGKSATVRAAKTQQAIAAVPADDPDSWDVTGTPDAALSLSEVDSARRAKSPAEGAAPLDLAEESSDGGSGVPIVWLIGAGMLIVGLAGAYLQEKRRR